MSINSNLQLSDYAGKEVWYRGCGLNMTNFGTSVTSGCVPVNNFGIRGMTCWCKTNLCNEDFISKLGDVFMFSKFIKSPLYVIIYNIKHVQ